MFEKSELDFSTGEQLKEKGITKTLNAVPEKYSELFGRAIEFLLKYNPHFTSDDVIELIGFPKDCSRNSIGALMNKFAKQGLIEPYGFTKGPRPSQHGHMIRTWVGKK